MHRCFRKTSVRNTQMIAHRQHPRDELFEKRGLYCNPDIPPGTRKHDEEEITYDCLALMHESAALSAAFSLRASYVPVTAEEAHASDQPRIVKVGYTDSEGLLAKNR